MGKKGQSQRSYSKEFKADAVRLSSQEGVSVTSVAEDLGIGLTTLSRWRAEARARGEEAFPGKGHQTPEDAEVTRLRRELARVTQQRDILKKAITFFHEDL